MAANDVIGNGAGIHRAGEADVGRIVAVGTSELVFTQSADPGSRVLSKSENPDRILGYYRMNGPPGVIQWRIETPPFASMRGGPASVPLVPMIHAAGPV